MIPPYLLLIYFFFFLIWNDNKIINKICKHFEIFVEKVKLYRTEIHHYGETMFLMSKIKNCY